MSDTDFAGLTEGLCIRFWGKPTEKSAKTLRWGSGGSRSYSFEKQAWYDHEAGKGGGAIALVERECSTDRDGALAWMEKEGLIDARHVASAAHQRQEAPKPSNEPPEQESLPVDAPQAKEEAVKGYRYTDGDGNHLYDVIRFQFRYPDGSWQLGKNGNPKKTFKQRRPDGKGGFIWGLGDVATTIYRRQEIEIAVAEGRTIGLTEGEKDVETLEAWEWAATTNSGGAQGWKPEFAEYLRGADVVIFGDDDDAGRARVETVALSLRGIAGRIRAIATWGGHKDVTDWRDAGGTAEQLLQIVQGLPDWKPRPPASKFGATTMTQIASKPIVYDWLIKHLIERQGILVVAGETGAGKTFFTVDMGMKIARGMEYGGRKVKQGLVAYIASEDGKGVKLRVEGYRVENNIPRDLDVPFVVLDPQAEGAKLFSLMSDESVDEMIRELLDLEAYYGQKLEMIFIDTISAAAEGLDENSSGEATKMLARANRLRTATKATVCLVHHMNANATKMRGSTAIPANVPNIIELRPVMTIPHRRDEKPVAVLDKEGRPLRRAVLTKNKNGLADVKWTFCLKIVPIGLDEDGEERTTCVCTRAARHSGSSGAEEEVTKLVGDQKMVFDALVSAQTEMGKDIPSAASAPPQQRRCVSQTDFVATIRKVISFKASEEEVEARNTELQAFLKRTTTSLINAGYMGRDNDLKICWWTGKSDRPRPRYQEQERPPEQPGAGIPEEVKQEIMDSGVPF